MIVPQPDVGLVVTLGGRRSQRGVFPRARYVPLWVGLGRARIGAVSGHEVEATIVLSHKPEERPRFPPIAPGNRSLLYQFESQETAGADESFGAVIEHAESMGSGYTVQLWFRVDLAATYPTPGAPFKIWYGRVSGSGSVLRILE